MESPKIKLSSTISMFKGSELNFSPQVFKRSRLPNDVNFNKRRFNKSFEKKNKTISMSETVSRKAFMQKTTKQFASKLGVKNQDSHKSIDKNILRK